MFENKELQTHLEESSTIKIQSAIVAEWNMNIPQNIKLVGNYRYRPQSTNTDDFKYKIIPSVFDSNDAGNFYTGATDADIVIDGGFDDDDTPQIFKTNKEKTKLLYSLEDCFGKFRPRSGINKASYFNNKNIHHSNINLARRPRYYMSDKSDKFKYWTSFRTENNIEYGVANKTINGNYFIDDAAPFVVYNDPVPANRLIVKMQTNIGDIDLGPFSGPAGSFSDPFYGDINKTTPVKWKIQYLQNNSWIDAISFDESSLRKDGTPIIKSDGYVELSYGLKVPDKYREVFVKAEEYTSASFLPEKNIAGYAYLIKETDEDLGEYHIWFDGQYEIFTPTYGWYLEEETVDRLTNFVTDLTNPHTFINTVDSRTTYREFEYISGIRVVVDTMNKVNCTFDLIELSPRLSVDLSNKTLNYDISKTASDLGTNGLPVGQLLASVGNLVLFDYDDAFNSNNSGSIISNYLYSNIQIKFYEIIVDVDGFDYFVPIKTMYSEGFPKIETGNRNVTLKLRDMYFYFESITAPQILVTNVSLSYAVSLLLDNIGFSNYLFKRLEGESELIIPFFFIGPDKTIAEVLNDLAVSTQTAMFFDEYNNFVMMSKDYIMPAATERVTDFILRGSQDMYDDGVIENKTSNIKLANIVDIAFRENSVYNDGSINYTTRHIQKTYGSIRQASLIDNAAQAKSWIYKPALLWEITGTENTKSINDQSSSQSSYVLSAIPLNSNLTNLIPSVINNKIINNVMDLGEGVYWLGKYNGYFYSGGEIIKFDAVEYSISGYGNIWINNMQEYQNYFSKLPFNGKIYPTGLVRIYAQPDFEEVSGVLQLKNGPVAKHGRGQFGTTIVNHFAGLNPYWYDNNYVRGCTMKSEYLFTLVPDAQSSNVSISELGLTNSAAGINNSLATNTTRNGIIKNFLSTSYLTETGINDLKSTQTGTIQSSALVMNGPSFSTTESPINFISYQYKKLTDKYKHFGTRMRIIGKIENSETRGQSPINSSTYYVVTGSQPNQQINVSGGSGGLAVLLNPETNVGYYFELVALTANNVSNYTGNTGNLHNIIFYKVMADGSNNAVPIKLWGGLGNILVDDGKFTGQYRMVGEENPTVYDLAVEYQDIGKIRRFYLYINNKLITTVDDNSPLPIYNNMAPFVRGGSRIMFENLYALNSNYSQNTVFTLDTPVPPIVDDNEIDANESFKKYAMSGIIQSTYLSGISPQQPPQYNIYFEEFGSIMREAAYFNVRYDKAYPALYAKISPTFNRIKGYTISGFRAGSYAAEFLIFNATDTALSLDETTGNYLRIQGITFTQESEHQFTMDEYFSKNSDFNNINFINSDTISAANTVAKKYEDIKISRMSYGKKDFSLSAPYIQTYDDANDLMSWIIDKTIKPRKSIGLEIFSIPTLQLGDIVTIDYNIDGINSISDENSRFVVYNIDYQRDGEGPKMTVHLSEV